MSADTGRDPPYTIGYTAGVLSPWTGNGADNEARHCAPRIYSRFGFDEDAAAIAKLPSLAGAAG